LIFKKTIIINRHFSKGKNSIISQVYKEVEIEKMIKMRKSMMILRFCTEFFLK